MMVSSQIINTITVTCIILSICTFCAGTHTAFIEPIPATSKSAATTTKNASSTMPVGSSQTYPLQDYWDATGQLKLNGRPKQYLFIIECFCNAWFTFELITRFIVSPHKMHFIHEGVNIIDFLATINFYIAVFQRVFKLEGILRDILDVLSIVRILRIFKLTRHHPGLKILQLTLKASARELFLLILFLIFGVVIFSAMVYFAEKMELKRQKDTQNDFQSIIDGFWWSVVTMTTVGYGDMVPRSYSGMLVGMLCALAGVLTTSLPIPVIVSNFTQYYQHLEARKKLPKKRRRFVNILPNAKPEPRPQRQNRENRARKAALQSDSSRSPVLPQRAVSPTQQILPRREGPSISYSRSSHSREASESKDDHLIPPTKPTLERLESDSEAFLKNPYKYKFPIPGQSDNQNRLAEDLKRRFHSTMFLERDSNGQTKEMMSVLNTQNTTLSRSMDIDRISAKHQNPSDIKSVIRKLQDNSRESLNKVQKYLNKRRRSKQYSKQPASRRSSTSSFLNQFSTLNATNLMNGDKGSESSGSSHTLESLAAPIISADPQLQVSPFPANLPSKKLPDRHKLQPRPQLPTFVNVSPNTLPIPSQIYISTLDSSLPCTPVAVCNGSQLNSGASKFQFKPFPPLPGKLNGPIAQKNPLNSSSGSLGTGKRQRPSLPKTAAASNDNKNLFRDLLEIKDFPSC